MAVDLRSDTVTLPTTGMYERMLNATLGDDGLDSDPSAGSLERHTAELLGKAAGLYVPTATMANLLAVLSQTKRFETIVTGAGSHIHRSERGIATLTGAPIRTVRDPDGALDLHALYRSLFLNKAMLPVRLVCMESSHNNEGGAVISLEHMHAVYAMTHSAGARVHLDGARIFNAAVALGVPALEIGRHADTVSVCLSKGLSAPVGAVLVGCEDTIGYARAIRKVLGGTQRQVGIVAAAGLEAIETMIDRLSLDHALARQLAFGIDDIPGLRVRRPQTNIVQLDVSASGLSPDEWERRLRERGILARVWGRSLLRCVTHRHIDDAAIRKAIEAFHQVAEGVRLLARQAPGQPATARLSIN